MDKATSNSAGGTIVLIGLRGSGKSTVGAELAKLAGGDFLDTDELIVEQAGCSISAIFDREGESGFRRREREAIRQAVARAPAVLSVGGGAVLDSRNVQAIRSAGKVIWLVAPPEILWERIRSDPSTRESRPDLTDMGGLDEVRQLLSERESFYKEAADLTIETSSLGPRDIADRILN